MADLSNSKIKDTYGRLLQRDPTTGELQDLDGANPTNLVFDRTTILYDDGNQQSGYVLKSDALGNASWGEVSTGDLYISAATLDNTILKLQTTSGSTISVPVSYWSSDGLGNYANSGLTGNIGIGVETPNEKLTVLGAISATTDLYLGCEAYEDSTITAQEQLTIKGRGADNDYMVLKQDTIGFYLDGMQAAKFMSTSTGATPNTGAFHFNTSGQDYDFKIIGEDYPVFNLSGSQHRIRIRNHVTIGPNDAVSHADAVNWGLAVTGSSLFYSGGTAGTNKNAIDAYGDMAITGDINIFGNKSLRTANITTTGGTAGESLTIEAGTTNIRNEDGATEYLKIHPNGFTFLVNDTEAFVISTASKFYYFDGRPGSGTDWYDFEFAGDNGYDIFNINSQWEISRFRNHLVVGTKPDYWTNLQALDYGLMVSGSSKFYSGGTSGVNINAIESSGNITLAANMVAVGDVISSGLTATRGTITSGTTNLLDIFAQSSEIHPNHGYWSGTTGGSLFPVSPTNTKLGIGTSTPVQTLEVAGSISASTTLNVGTDITVGNDLKFPDNGQAIFGDGSDLSIIHNSVKSIITNTTGELLFENEASDADIRFKGNDNTSTITALTLDMSDAGTATFNNDIRLSGNIVGKDVMMDGHINVTGTTTGGGFTAVGGGLFTGDLVGLVTTGIQTEITACRNLVTVGTITTGWWSSDRRFTKTGVEIGDYDGDVVFFGTEMALTIGSLYYFDGASWVLTDANAIVSSTKLLGIALGEDPSEGMLLRGMVTLATTPGGADGDVLYLSETAGKATTTIPTTSGAIVRVIGYAINTGDGIIWFNPDNTWVELS